MAPMLWLISPNIRILHAHLISVAVAQTGSSESFRASSEEGGYGSFPKSGAAK